MYRSQEDFVNDLKAAWRGLLTRSVIDKKYVTTNLSTMAQSPYFNEFETVAAYGWRLYVHSYKNKLDLLLLGSNKIRKDEELLRNFGTTSVTPTDESQSTFLGESIKHVMRVAETKGYGDMTGYDGMSTTAGSVLGEKLWVPVLNDIWLVAGCHRISSFYLGALSEGTMWSKKHDRPRILGREIIGLLAFGYGLIDTPGHELVGSVFAPTDRARAQGATLVTMAEAVASVTSLAALKVLITSSVKRYDQYHSWDIKLPEPKALKGKILSVVETIVGYDAQLNEGGPLRYAIAKGKIRLSGDVKQQSGLVPRDFLGVCVLGGAAEGAAVVMKSLHGFTTVQVSNPLEVIYVDAAVLLNSPNVIRPD